MGKLSLKSEQDGMGYYYGDYTTDDDRRCRVDVLPPRSHPRPCFVMDNSAAHDTEWIVYADGEEIARVLRREDIETALACKVVPPPE